jgi:hypothetical protein
MVEFPTNSAAADADFRFKVSDHPLDQCALMCQKGGVLSAIGQFGERAT